MKRGFTLAEVLVTICIIAIVVVMVIPAQIQKLRQTGISKSTVHYDYDYRK